MGYTPLRTGVVYSQMWQGVADLDNPKKEFNNILDMDIRYG